jgi:hypothetical protein
VISDKSSVKSSSNSQGNFEGISLTLTEKKSEHVRVKSGRYREEVDEETKENLDDE